MDLTQDPDDTPPLGRPLRIWAVSDGRAGIESQVLGLSEAVARLRTAEIEIKRVQYRPAYDRWPTAAKLWPKRMLTPDSSAFDGPFPDIFIAAGRASLPFSLRMRGWSKGESLVVQVQDPRWPPQLFDLVVPPKHDSVVGENVFPITGSPHRITPDQLAAARARFDNLAEGLPSPRIAVLIGGKSGSFDISVERAAKLATDIGLMLDAEKASLLMTFSRRTPDRAKDILTARLKDYPGLIWDGVSPNPYFAFLEAADYILVTEDSTNMATEAASTGKPVFILPIDGDNPKFRRFHEELERRDAARPFGGALYRWDYAPLNETRRAAKEILRRWDLKQSKARAG